MFNKKVNVTIDIQAKDVLLGERDRRASHTVKFSKFFIELNQLPVITLGNYLPIAYTAVTNNTENLRAYFKTKAEARAADEKYRDYCSGVGDSSEPPQSIVDIATDELNDFEARFQTDYQVMVAKGEIRESFIYEGKQVYIAIKLEEVAEEEDEVEAEY